MIIQNRAKNGKVRSQNFNNPSSTQSCLESIENQLSSSGIFSPGFTTIEIVGEIRKDLDVRHMIPEQVEGTILFMSYVQRH